MATCAGAKQSRYFETVLRITGLLRHAAHRSAPFLAMTVNMKSVMGPNSEKLRADVPNYTNIQPVIQVGEVVQ